MAQASIFFINPPRRTKPEPERDEEFTAINNMSLAKLDGTKLERPGQ